ncbi:uncharacterized protein si:rp71-46j2.7 isoform X2 [Heterodontus francisci]|uniref:uncharacterized protein si:rp71-46j2.7 isoform X2 n=1 Tax=Heterodontus francisci TaxID=7792 RepID=UPI00355AF0B7
MSLIQLLFGILFVAPFIYWNPSLLNLLLLLLSWWFVAPVGEGCKDERDHSPDTGNQQFSERTAERMKTNQPDNHVDVTDGEVRSSTVLDPSLRQSLRNVFDCSYSQFILLWYNPPEPTENQPLYQVLLNEFNVAVDYAVGKIRRLDLTRIELGFIRILTDHLRTAKKGKKRKKIFQTRQKEVCFLRRTSEALICNLLPDSVWKLNCYQHFLKEVVALKVLEEVINTVCDADFINQALIKFLDKDSSATKEEEIILDDFAKAETNDEINIKCNIPKGQEKKKKKSNKKTKLQNFFKKFSKKSKKVYVETGSTLDNMDEVDGQFSSEFGNFGQKFRSLASSNGLYLDNRIDDSAEEEDDNSSHEMLKWLTENILIPIENEKSSLRNCTITISEVSWDEIENPSCTIDIESLEAAEDCWSVQRKYHEFVDLHKELCKTFSSFVETNLPPVNCMSSDKINNEFKEDVKCQLNGFLKKLVSEESILCNESILNFFSANDQFRDYWGLLTSLFTEEDEETDADSGTSEGPCDTVVGEVEPMEINPENRETQIRGCAESRPSEIFCESSESDFSFRSMSAISETKDTDAAGFGRRKRKKWALHKIERPAEQPECIINQLHELLEELFCTECFSSNKIYLQLAKCILPFIKTRLQKKLDQFFSKEQMTVYIDCLRETLWPNGKPAEPPPERSNKEKAFAKERAEELLQEKVAAIYHFLLCGKEIVQILLTVFQDAETNKRLVYNVLVFLLFEIIPGIKDSWSADTMPCLDVDELNDKPL